MRTLGNILWFLFGGLIGGLAWTLAGCIWCITIIGIPFGLQCFKFALLAFFPFGKAVPDAVRRRCDIMTIKTKSTGARRWILLYQLYV